MLDRDELEHLFTLAGHTDSASDCENHEVALAPSTPRKQFRNPVVGLLRFDAVSSWLTPRAGARMLVYTPADARSRHRLDELARAMTRPAIA
jgi:hypothetical protein